MDNKPKAYSYIRFSTPEQEKGDSFRRQLEDAKKYAKKHDLILDESQTTTDLGVWDIRALTDLKEHLINLLNLLITGKFLKVPVFTFFIIPIQEPGKISQ